MHGQARDHPDPGHARGPGRAPGCCRGRPVSTWLRELGLEEARRRSSARTVARLLDEARASGPGLDEREADRAGRRGDARDPSRSGRSDDSGGRRHATSSSPVCSRLRGSRRGSSTPRGSRSDSCGPLASSPNACASSTTRASPRSCTARTVVSISAREVLRALAAGADMVSPEMLPRLAVVKADPDDDLLPGDRARRWRIGRGERRPAAPAPARGVRRCPDRRPGHLPRRDRPPRLARPGTRGRLRSGGARACRTRASRPRERPHRREAPRHLPRRAPRGRSPARPARTTRPCSRAQPARPCSRVSRRSTAPSWRSSGPRRSRARPRLAQRSERRVRREDPAFARDERGGRGRGLPGGGDGGGPPARARLRRRMRRRAAASSGRSSAMRSQWLASSRIHTSADVPSAAASSSAVSAVMRLLP